MPSYLLPLLAGLIIGSGITFAVIGIQTPSQKDHTEATILNIGATVRILIDNPDMRRQAIQILQTNEEQRAEFRKSARGLLINPRTQQDIIKGGEILFTLMDEAKSEFVRQGNRIIP